MEASTKRFTATTGHLRLLEEELPGRELSMGMLEKTLRLMTGQGLPEESLH